MVNVRALAQDSVNRIGGNGTMVDYLVQMAAIESGNNPNARNPKSSAGGLFQQLDSNWKAYGRGGNRFNAADSTDAALRFALDNRETMMNITGREPTPGEYYLAHFAGPGGVSRILKSDEDTPLSAIKGGQAIINSNKGVRLPNGKPITSFTAGDLREWADAKMGADISGKAAYNERYSSGQTSASEDALEYEKRMRYLMENGYDEKTARGMSKEEVFGLIFIKILENLFNSDVKMVDEKGRDRSDLSIDNNRASEKSAKAPAMPDRVAAAVKDAGVSSQDLKPQQASNGDVGALDKPASVVAAAASQTKTLTPA